MIGLGIWLWPVAATTTGPAPPSSAFRAVSGTYTGTNADQDVALPFVPDAVYVWTELQPLIWRNRSSWHGRTQELRTAPSSYVLGPGVGRFQPRPFDSEKFSVGASYSASGVVYRYLALKKNGTNTLEEVSIIGNGLTDRQVDFTSRISDLIIVKRDSTQPAVFGTRNEPATRADISQGPLPTGQLLPNATGALVGTSVTLNENNNAGRGEGIEFQSFIERDGVKIIRRTGTGGAATVTGLGHTVMIVNAGAGSTAQPQIVREGDTGCQFNGASPATVISLAGGVLTLPALYNTAGVDFVIASFADAPSALVPEPSTLPAATNVGMVYGSGQLSSGLALSGACTYEYYGRPFGTEPSMATIFPLLMFGNGTDGATSGMNGGLYLAQTDPDGNGWRGGVLRVIHSSYLASLRNAPHNTINYYNLNTGILIPDLGAAIHVVVKHNGTGKWRVWLNGQLEKEYNVDLNQATYGNRINGGGGTSLPVYVGGVPSDAARQRASEIYRVQLWNSELTDAQAASLFANAVAGSLTTAPTAANIWDFRGSLPGGVSGITLATKKPDGYNVPFFRQGTNPLSSGAPVLQSNGDVLVTTVTGSVNGRAFVSAQTGTYKVRSVIDPGQATQIILRLATNTDGNATGATDVFTIVGSALIDRTDTVTVPGGRWLHYIGLTAEGASFTIKASTVIERIA